ncbi:peptidoglycan recognition protein family protein, partial [Escherichia coli]|uniref:peptidoglycan recognition protein family protein n=1 Tax=Escherichia coli TaxID=562 RepID=UPI003D2F3088
GAQTSAHFVVSGGRVHCIVSPTDTAWHAGLWDENLRSIGIECRPEATAADYATVAELVRWLRNKYGNLPLRPHKQFYSTDCPGRWDLSRLDLLARG